MIPLVVCDRPLVPASALAEWAEAGWRVDAGVQLPAEPWDLADRRWLRTCSVPDVAALEAVVLAAVRGVGVAAGCPDPEVRAQLLDDLGRLGAVTLLELGPDPLAALDAEQRTILEVLVRGGTVAEAAARTFLSNRTAERKLASARRALGVRTTAEAVALASAGGFGA